MRRDVRYLLTEGHADALSYPLAMVWNEARETRKQVNNRIASDVTMLFNVVSAAVGGDAKHLKKITKGLRDGDG